MECACPDRRDTGWNVIGSNSSTRILDQCQTRLVIKYPVKSNEGRIVEVNRNGFEAGAITKSSGTNLPNTFRNRHLLQILTSAKSSST